MTDTLTAALGYAALGWPVIALHTWTGEACSCGNGDCPSPAKHPRTRHGLTDATTDPDVIAGWWARWPDANVGLLTGVLFDVLDVDGEPGDRALAAAAGGAEMMTEGPMTTTGKGWHMLFQPTGEGNRTRIVELVDWRGGGGYIVAPPSIHATGRRYEWLPGCGPETPLQPVPPWLQVLVVKPPYVPPSGPMPPLSAKGGNYAQRALQAEVGCVAMSVPGTRNDTLNKAAFSLGQLVAGGELDTAEVVGALLDVSARIGLAETEAEATILSGLRRGMETPRRRPA